MEEVCAGGCDTHDGSSFQWNRFGEVPFSEASFSEFGLNSVPLTYTR